MTTNADSNASHFRARKLAWWDWHNSNPMFWKYFERIAMEAAGRGAQGISQFMVAHMVRWQMSVVEKQEELIPSNEFVAFFARYWDSQHPQHSGLFKQSSMKGERQHLADKIARQVVEPEGVQP